MEGDADTRLRVCMVDHNVFSVRLADRLKNTYPQINQPEWARFVKTCPARIEVPKNPEWWYVRAASIMRKLALNGGMTIRDFEVAYGGKRSSGRRPEKFVPAAGGHLRRILKQLESAGLVESQKGSGRTLTAQGVALIRKVADELVAEQLKRNPALTIYV
ncbi:MAG: 40S ribosomal protein S19 [Thermoprotei archaeon]